MMTSLDAAEVLLGFQETSAAPTFNCNEFSDRVQVGASTVPRRLLEMIVGGALAGARRLTFLTRSRSDCRRDLFGAGPRQSGNSTPAHYLKLLASAGMLVGLHKLAGQVVLEQAKADRSLWGRLVESATGAYLFNGCVTDGHEPFYWREGNKKGGLRSEERALVDRWIA